MRKEYVCPKCGKSVIGDSNDNSLARCSHCGRSFYLNNNQKKVSSSNTKSSNDRSYGGYCPDVYNGNTMQDDTYGGSNDYSGSSSDTYSSGSDSSDSFGGGDSGSGGCDGSY